MKKIIIFLILVTIPLFLIKEVNAALEIPTVYTEISNLSDLPDVVTRPVATTSDAIYIEGQDIPGHPELYLQPKLYFKDLANNWYLFVMKDEFTSHIKNLARTKFIQDTGITPGYFVKRPQYEQEEPTYLSWLMEYQAESISITFNWLAMDSNAQPIQFYNYTYYLTNEWNVNGNWESVGYYKYYTDVPQANDEMLIVSPNGQTLSYSMDGYTFEPVPDHDNMASYDTVKLSVFTDTEDNLNLVILGYRPNKYNPNISDEVILKDLGIYDPALFQLRYYDIDSVNDIPSDNLSTVNELPETTGNILGTSGEMGNVDVFVSGTTLLATITYGGVAYHVKYNFAANTDMSIFQNKYEIFYYTSMNEKFIIINHGNASIFLYEDLMDKPFIPFTVWNLSTNQIKTVDRYNVYMYTKVEDNKNLYAYFYVDNYIIDHLVSVTLSMRYYYKYFELGGDFSKAGEWQYYYKVLEDDVVNEGGGLSWEAQLVTNVATAALYPFYGLFAIAGNKLGIQFIGSSILNETPNKYFNFGSIDEIQELTPSTALRSELNEAYISNYPEFDGMNNELGVWKLHLGRFDKFGSTGIYIDPEFNAIGNQKGLNIIEFTYITNGELYTIKGENINVFFAPGPGTDTPAVDEECGILCQINRFLEKFYIVAVGIVWFKTVQYSFRPVASITGKKLTLFTRLIIAAAWFAVVYYVISWLIQTTR